jgi:DinB superfamily
VDLEKLKYPIGKFDNDKNQSAQDIETAKTYLAGFPALLIALTKTLSNTELSKTYRPEGWSIRQIVHHIADSHMHMYMRTKFALTEQNPTIKGYDEVVWANMPDSNLPIDHSLGIISGLHARLVETINNMKPEDFEKTFFHAGYQKDYILNKVIPLYAWHSEHHLEHIKLALKN